MRETSLRLSTILNRPLALESRRTAEIRSALIAHGPHAPLASGPFDASDDRRGYWGVPLQVSGSVGVISISGILLSGPGGCLYPMASFYEDIRARLDEAIEDDRIKVIALWIDSPGGMVSQCFELADHIYHAGAQKPVVAIIYDCACSAAYALASSAEAITVPKSGTVGSIGVIMIHAEYSAALERAGIHTTIFRYGAHKAELQEVEPLSAEAAAREQADIDALGEQFVTLVARNRGMEADAVRATQAEAYLGDRGVALGLADAVMPPHDALADLIARFP